MHLSLFAPRHTPQYMHSPLLASQRLQKLRVHLLITPNIVFLLCVHVLDKLRFPATLLCSSNNSSEQLTPAGVRGRQGSRAIREKYGL